MDDRVAQLLAGMQPPVQQQAGAMGQVLGAGQPQTAPSAGIMSDASPDPVSAGDQFAQASGPFVISPGAGGRYSVIDIRTGQVRYAGSLDGARQAQAQLGSGR